MNLKILRIIFASIFLFCITVTAPITGNAIYYQGTSYKGDYMYGNIFYSISNNEIAITDCVRSTSRELIIPKYINNYKVTSIGSLAFWFFRGLTSITIPDSVTSIGDCAFENCSGLTSITIPDSVTSIGNYAFSGCSGLTSITIPDSVTSIGNYAFEKCSGLTGITIPDSVTSIGDYAFNGTKWLDNQPNGLIYINKILYKYKGTMSSNTSIKLQEGIISICGLAFSRCSGLTSITIPDSVTSIGNYAFSGCSGLTSITIPGSVTSIGDCAFEGCSGLTSITIPGSVTSIGSYAFNDCSGLTGITIPDSVTSIGNYAFNRTKWLENQPDGLVYAGKNAYDYKGTMPSNTSIDLEEGTVSICGYAFYGCSGLTSITIPDSVTSIGSGAFKYCSNLTKITMPFISSEPFGYIFSIFDEDEDDYEDGYEANGYLIPWSLKTVNITKATKIPEKAFYDCCLLTSITIPDSVTSIGSYAFEECSGLTRITIPNSVTSIGSYAFEKCSGLTRITIPDSVTSIGNSAFYGCSELTSVTIPDSVTNIGDSAFSSCNNLTIHCHPNATAEAYADKNNIPVSYYGFDDDLNTLNWSKNISIEHGESSSSFLSVLSKIGISAIIIQLKYHNGIDVNILDASDFKYVSIDEKVVGKEYTTQTVTCQYSDDGAINAERYRKLFSVEVSNSDSSLTGDYPLVVTSVEAYDSNYDLFQLDTINNLPITIQPTLVNSIDVIGNDDCIGSASYSVNIEPADANDKSITWSVDDASIATIDQDGVLTAIGDGTITIKATANDGSEVFATKPVTVHNLKIKTITINGTSEAVGKATYSVDIAPDYAENKSVAWSVDNESIATIDQDGVLTAIGDGTVTIKATANDGSEVFATKPVTVHNLKVKSITIKGESEAIGKATYSVDVTPDYAENKGVAWSVDNENIATVDQDGVLTAIGDGTVTIKATANDGSGVYATKTVMVHNFKVKSIKISGNDTVEISAKFTAIASPEYAEDKTVSWSVSDSSMATIDENGVLYALKSGSVQVIATANDGSGVYGTKEVALVPYNTITTLTSNIGYWDKTYTPFTFDYTIYVPTGTTQIKLTNTFTGGTVKLNGSSICINKAAKAISLKDGVNNITLVRSGVTNTIDTTYNITVMVGDVYASQTISDNMLTFDIHSLVDKSVNLFSATYNKDGRLLKCDTEPLNLQVNSSLSKSYDIETLPEDNVFKFFIFENAFSPVIESISYVK